MTLYNNVIKKYDGLFVFFLIFLSLFPLIFYGINLSDFGYNLANQMMAAHKGVRYINVQPFWWLTDIIGGGWLDICPEFGLWWAGLGGCLAYALTGLFTVYGMRAFFESSWLMVLSIWVSSFFIVCAMGAGHVLILQYYTIPMLLGSLFFLFFIQCHRNPNSLIFPVLCGIFMALLVFSKITTISCFIFPLLVFVFQKNTAHSNFKLRLRALFLIYVFALCLLMIFLRPWLHAFHETLFLKNTFYNDSTLSLILFVIKNDLKVVWIFGLFAAILFSIPAIIFFASSIGFFSSIPS